MAKESKTDNFLDDNYKKCLSHVFCKFGESYFLTRKDFASPQMKDNVARFTRIDVPYFTIWVYDVTTDTRILSYSPKIESLNKQLFAEYKKRGGTDYLNSGDDVLLLKIKDKICKKEGIEK